MLQMFYDDANSALVGNGYLLLIKPRSFDNTPQTIFSNTGVFEIRMKREGPNSAVYISFRGIPWQRKSPSYPVNGRIKMIEDATQYYVTGLVYTHVDGSAGNVTCATGSGNTYYTVAYVAGKQSPFYTTALWGWNDTSVSNTMCGDNSYQYGHFNSASGFVCDGQSTSCPDGSPYPLSENVYRSYSHMDNTNGHEFNEGTIGGLVIRFVGGTTFD
jgi:hypothetical protein